MTFTPVSFELPGEVVVFMIPTDEDVADSLAPKIIRGIIASLHLGG